MGYEKHDLGECKVCSRSLWGSITTFESRFEPALEPPEYDGNISETDDELCENCWERISELLEIHHNGKKFDSWYICRSGEIILHIPDGEEEEISLGDAREFVENGGNL